MQSSIHPYFNWAKERLDEMDATLASLEGKVGEVQADARAKADNILADLRKKREDFQDIVKKQSQVSETAWASAKGQLESDWNAFEAEVKKYVENFGKQIEQQKAIFALQSAAQLKAWHEAADKFAGAAKEYATERRGEIDTVVKQMKTDAATAEETLQKLTQAGNQSWTALTAALNETRAAFDRADQAAREAFKKATAA
jgi:hypothetical protein